MKKISAAEQGEASHRLTEALNQDIPISRAMGFRIVRASPESVVLFAPLTPNSNHKGTGFGGSIYSAGVLAGWTLVSEVLKAHHILSDYIVIQDSSMEYFEAVDSDFTAEAQWATANDPKKLLEMISRKGLGRVTTSVDIFCASQLRARLTARFVVSLSPP